MTLQNIIDNYESISFSDLRKTPLAHDHELTKEIQRILKKTGLYHSLIDGEFGPLSKTALQDFIESEGLSQDYILDDIVADLLVEKNQTSQQNYLNDDFGDTKEDFIDATIEACRKHGLPLNEQIAYVLATAEHETAATFKPIEEAFWLKDADAYRKKHFSYYPYYGRGYVQITHKSNYKKYSDLLGIDFLSDPDKVLEKNISLFILVYGMAVGNFTGKRLGDYVNKNEKEFKRARKVINGNDKAAHIANIAEKWLQILTHREEKTVPQTRSISPSSVSNSSIEKYKRLR